MKIAFIWYWDRASEILPHWRDGLRGAIEIIGKQHEVVWFLDCKVPDPKGKWDFILFWGDSNLPFFNELDKYPCRKGICLSTNPHNIDNLKKVDVVFCESTPVYEEVRRYGLRAIKAFGTDEEFFTPDPLILKTVPFFYPATFSPWKRQSSIAHIGNKLTCVGTIQPDGKEEFKACKKNKVNLEVGYFPPEKIRNYYNMAQRVLIPAVHGSERTCLEAMSMDIFPEVNKDNKKTYSYIEEYKRSQAATPRLFIYYHYSKQAYADRLMKGING